jgi:hypothetical protein
MVLTETLFAMADEHGIEIVWYDLWPLCLGLYTANPTILSAPVIGLDNSLATNERMLRCVLAHELGHHMTSAAPLTAAYSNPLLIIKSETRANQRALDLLLPSEQFIRALNPSQSFFDLADEFHVLVEWVVAKFRQLVRRGHRELIEIHDKLWDNLILTLEPSLPRGWYHEER